MGSAPDFVAQRQQMVATQLESRGIRDQGVLSALRSLPRELFLPGEVALSAYEDRAVPVGFGQTISQPYIVAYMTEALALAPRHRVLEVGTGTGYQTALLSRLTARVYTVERLADFSVAAQARLAHLGANNVCFRVGDGSLGWPEQAPFDRIIVTAAAREVPSCLVSQLAGAGRLVMPVGDEGSQRLVMIENRGGRFVEEPMIPVRFVRLVGARGYPE
jgi:protein-L-isoaspartate(D-aspartate) O-methyltransferase